MKETTIKYHILGEHKLELEGKLPLTLHPHFTLVDQAKRLVPKQ